ncbi:ribosomal RNAprocessing protein putative [Polychytrium aggregatum]|uniref:ribosomal RNAprocessing protein putative n=1 Tax=Polychytrium aggregatum TaxID=110093 RepID=UPI0022FE109E|nr:ribosomal RNAprocessing protein putative [Polychytrium aggregatum]KAI9202025.1 ribosomal RNAprocessing protein putative [Polychytrium aggregatum]
MGKAEADTAIPSKPLGGGGGVHKKSKIDKAKLKQALEKSKSIHQLLTTKSERPSSPNTPAAEATADQDHQNRQKIEMARHTRSRSERPSVNHPEVEAKSQPGNRDLTDFQKKMQKRLSGGQFRWINERLYTSGSESMFKLFQENPDYFAVYHDGFREQVEHWPQNPIDTFIAFLQDKPKSTVVADMGCGEAMIAQKLHRRMTIHSFDLVAGNSFITACDISKVPLENEAVDVVIFCLSLMGTNFMDFLMEANRILKIRGELKIAEVTSRFTNLDDFVGTLQSIGFKFLRKDTSNKMFVMLDFVKTRRPKGATHRAPDEPELLKPCIYKRR